MTDIESILQSIKERADRATRGRWFVDPDAWPSELSVVNSEVIIVTTATNNNSRDMEGQKEAQRNDLTFIAASRTDVPRLVEAVRVLAEEINFIRQCGGLTEHDLAVQALQRATEILKGV